MEVFVLSIQLYLGAPIQTFPVRSCEVGLKWEQAAWQWAARSKVAISNVTWACKRAQA